jgi:hypothetical protein
MRSKPGPPMTLQNMRKNGVRAVTATCEACGREADVNVDALPETVTGKPSANDGYFAQSGRPRQRHLPVGPKPNAPI